MTPADDRTDLAERLGHPDRIRALPPEVARIHVDPDVVAAIGPESAVRLQRPDGDARMQLETHAHIRGRGRHPVGHGPPVRPDLRLHLPRPDRLVIVADRPQAEDADRSAGAAARAARHRDDPVDPEERRQLDRASEGALCLGPRSRIGMERIARGVDGAEPDPRRVQIAPELVAGRLVAKERPEVQVGPCPPRPDAHLDVRDVVAGGPGQGVATRQVLQPVGEQPDPHERLLLSVHSVRLPAGVASPQAGSRRAERRGRPGPPRRWPEPEHRR